MQPDHSTLKEVAGNRRAYLTVEGDKVVGQNGRNVHELLGLPERPIIGRSLQQVIRHLAKAFDPDGPAPWPSLVENGEASIHCIAGGTITQAHFEMPSGRILEIRLASRLEVQESHTDNLTGLPNQKFLVDKLLPRQVARTRRTRNRGLGICVIDLNGFKQINDDLGHHVGDLLLQLFAERLREAVGEAGVAVRKGGDEFVVVLPEIRLRDAKDAIAKLAARLNDTPYTIRHGGSTTTTTRFGASIGVAWSAFRRADDDSIEALLQAADRAMYRAKGAQNKNGYVINGKR